ncbi:hypothetical protein F4604DRAFT_1688526 [Suillus subluteus]|nr:hypothetical protein F4604DRAFT_1688526 [Suillus subluteus]
MEAPSSPSSTITAPPDCRETARRLAKLIVEAMFCDFALLHYDSASKSMVEWWWPIDGDGNKVLPFNLEIHHEEYELKYPCCLCADGRGRTAYIECVVYSWRNKDTGQFYWTARLPTITTFQYPRRDSIPVLEMVLLPGSSTFCLATADDATHQPTTVLAFTLCADQGFRLFMYLSYALHATCYYNYDEYGMRDTIKSDNQTR